MKILHPPGHIPESADILRRAGYRLEVFSPQGIPRLDADSSESVCLIPWSCTQSKEWARLRVDLGRANRFYLVEVAAPETESIVEMMRDGAFDVLAKGDDGTRWEKALEKAVQSQELWVQLYAGKLEQSSGLVGRSRPMLSLRRDIERLGPTDVTVLLTGESGVGKERFALALHQAGRGGPLVTLNCAAMPKELLEAELFGAEKGSFTGAVKSRPGLVEQAAGGALFLDEVGEMDLMLQPKFLRFLESRRARRIGGEKEYSVSLRIISATNRDLETEVRAGRFRADLYYRLAEVVLRIPPLRERLDDIPDLASTFLGAANERFGKNVERLEPELVAKLQGYHWPGNVRELKSVIDRLVLFHDGPMLREGWWESPVELAPISKASVAPSQEAPPQRSVVEPSLPGKSSRVALARQLLTENQLSLAEIAARTGVHPTTLFRWRKAGKV